MPATRTLLAIFAHPDDEAFGTGGVLSKYAAQGVNVHLITATCGEAGQIADPALATPQTLARVREQELRCACRTYGINPPHLLHYPDGQTSQVNQKEAVGKIVHLIRRLKPQVVIAFGPDGIYGHYDHLVLHRWAVLAVDLAADPEWFPEQLTARRRTHTVGKLYYRAMPQSLIDSMRRDGGGYVMMDGLPFPFVGYPETQITTRIDVLPFVERKLKGILCHATQMSDSGPFAGEYDPTEEPWFHTEMFIRARSLVDVGPGVETDLFAGLP